MSAREAGRLPLEDALALVVLYAQTDDETFERAAVRWVVRLAEERRLSLAQVQPCRGGARDADGRAGAGVTRVGRPQLRTARVLAPTR